MCMSSAKPTLCQAFVKTLKESMLSPLCRWESSVLGRIYFTSQITQLEGGSAEGLAVVSALLTRSLCSLNMPHSYSFNCYSYRIWNALFPPCISWLLLQINTFLVISFSTSHSSVGITPIRISISPVRIKSAQNLWRSKSSQVYMFSMVF